MRWRNLLLLSGSFAMLATAAADPFQQAQIRQESGKVQPISRDGKTWYRLTGVTGPVAGESAQYRTFSLLLPQPLDLRGKQLKFQLSSPKGENVLAVYVRAFNSDEDKPAWSFYDYQYLFKDSPSVRAQLRHPGTATPLQWEQQAISGAEPDRINRIQFLIGSREANTPLEMEVGDFFLEDAPEEAADEPGKMPAAFFDPANLKGRNAKFTIKDGVFRLSGVTRKQDNTNYFVGEVRLPRPLNLSGQMVKFQISTTTPDVIVALTARFFSGSDAKPAWSFMQWGAPFSRVKTVTAQLTRDNGTPLIWQPEVASGLHEDAITRFEFWVGATVPDVPVEVTLSDFELLPASQAPAAMRWKPVPEYADRPANVRHPAGSIKEADILRARENLKKPENREILDGIRERAKFWMERTPEEIALLIPAEDAWFKCLCPNCGTQPEFAWEGADVLQPDWKSIRCTKCGMVFPNDQYPESSSYTIKTPRGKVKTIHYYHGKDQIAQGENYGPRYHLSGAVNYVKQRFLGRVYDTAMMYALTGDKAYAERVRDVLVRFAEVYPDYSVKFRATAYETPRGHYMGGKLCAWKFHDSARLPALLNAYCLTHDSGAYSDADKLAVENGICREYKWLITAYPPTKDWCLNAVPAHMTTAALCAAILGDHELMDWVLKGEEGFFAFLEEYYHRDGHWYENAPSYANMANDPMINLVCALQGYTDSPDYQGEDRYENFDVFKAAPTLKLVFSGMAPGTLPTGALPAVNDSSFSARQSIAQLETLAALQPTPENRKMLGYMASQFPVQWGREFSVLKRDAAWQMEETAPEDFTRSILFPGGGWALLRRPETYRDSAVMLYFGGDVGGHSHNCTLNYLYCDFGKEVVSDLGYLSWWHDNRTWNNSTFAHNLVVVDGKVQQKTRIGIPEFFTGSGEILAARFNAPQAYPGVTEEYARTIFSIPLPDHRQYLVDFFSVRGGGEHIWTFHADGETFTPPEGLVFQPARIEAEKDTGVEWLQNLRAAAIAPGVYRSSWQYDDELVTTQFFSAGKPMELLLADAPGLRNQKTPYLKVKLNLLLARAAGPDNVFASVLETNRKGQSAIQTVVPVATTQDSRPATALRIQLRSGGTDLVILSGSGTGEVRLQDYPQLRLDARAAVIRFDAAGKITRLWCVDGSMEVDGKHLNAGRAMHGKILAVDADANVLTTDLTVPPAVPEGNQYLVIPSRRDGAYRLIGAEQRDGRVQLRLHPDEVLRLAPGDEFIFCPYAENP